MNFKTLVNKEGKPFNVALGDKKVAADPTVGKSVDLASLNLETERDLTKIKLTTDEGPIVDSAVVIDEALVKGHAQDFDNKLAKETFDALAGKSFVDEQTTQYVFEKDCKSVTMYTNGTHNGATEFVFKFILNAGYCVLKADKKSKYPRKDALYYTYEKTEKGYNLKMTAPTLPSQYAPETITLTASKAPLQPPADVVEPPKEVSPDAAKEDVQAVVVDDTAV